MICGVDINELYTIKGRESDILQRKKVQGILLLLKKDKMIQGKINGLVEMEINLVKSRLL